MAVTAIAKINEMLKNGKADINIRDQYRELEEQYKTCKVKYKNYRDMFKSKEEELRGLQIELKNTPFFKKGEIRKKITVARQAKARLEGKCKSEKEKYKQKLKELRQLKNAIRKQYKNYKMFEKLCEKSKEAKEMGIKFYLQLDKRVSNQKKLYKKVIFKMDEKGEVISDIPQPDIDCIKEVDSLIREAKAKARQEKFQDAMETVKGLFTRPGEDDEEVEPGD